MFVNRSFQNCNLVYSIHSETQLLSAPRNSAQIADTQASSDRISVKRADSNQELLSSRPRTSQLVLRNNQRISISTRPATAQTRGGRNLPVKSESSDDNIGVRASVTVNPAEIMVMYNMQYKGQLQRTETIAEDDDEGLDEADSVVSELGSVDEDGRRHTILKKDTGWFCKNVTKMAKNIKI